MLRSTIAYGLALAALVGISACAGTAGASLADAQIACGEGEPTTAATRLPDIDAVPLADLQRNAEQAGVRAVAAQRAAAGDARWGALADAMQQIATLAERLATAAESGRPASSELTEADWYAYKAASNASVLECREVAARG